jgi:hypothetical protein
MNYTRVRLIAVLTLISLGLFSATLTAAANASEKLVTVKVNSA